MVQTEKQATKADSQNLDAVQSDWQEFFPSETLDYEGPTPKIKKIATYLRQAFPDDEIELEIEFQSYALLNRFEKKLQLEYEIYRPQQMIIEKNDWDNILKEIRDQSFFKRKLTTDKMKSEKILFGTSLQCSIFYFNYEKKLKKMEVQYNYIIVPFKKTIGVFMKNVQQDKINSFFKNEIFQMKTNLIYYVSSDYQIFKQARYSQKTIDSLEKLKIKSFIISRLECAVFFSQDYKHSYEIIKKVEKTMTYHVSVIKFPERFVNKYILKEIMRLIYYGIKPALKEIQTYCDMPVQVDIEKAAIVITDFHEIFSDGVDLVRQNLAKLKILEIQCKSLIDLKQIMLKAQFLQIVRFNYRYRRCFLLFSDTVTEKNYKTLKKFCAEISTVFKGKYKIVVHLSHLFEDKENLRKEAQRIINIGAQCRLNNITFSSFYQFKNFDKLVFEPVQLSIYAAQMRRNQIKSFLFKFLGCKKQLLQQFNQPVLETTRADEFKAHKQDESSTDQAFKSQY